MFSFLLSLLFPPTKDEEIVAKCAALPCDIHSYTTPTKIPVTTCSSYKATDVRAAISLLKNKGSRKAAQLCANLVSDFILDEVADTQLWDSNRVVIVPLPRSPQRRRTRGFNHVEKICEQLPQDLKQYVDSNTLTQIKNTKPQKMLSRPERFENVKNAFAVHGDLTNTHVFLIDDVHTTGATLQEASRILHKAGACVHGVAVARA